MQKKGFRRLAKLVGAAMVASLIVAPQAMAQNGTTGGADTQTAAETTAALVATFNKDSAAFLAGYTQGGLALTLAVQTLIQADPTLINAIVAMAAGANPEQIKAIARALATAAKAFLSSNPDAAASIQLAVANSGNQALIDAFNAASNETPTAALPGTQPAGTPATPASPIGNTDSPAGGDVTGGGTTGSGSGGGASGSGGAGFTPTTGGGAVSPTV